MTSYLEDPIVDRLAERLSLMRHVDKVEAVRTALQRALDEEERKEDLLERGLAITRELRAKASQFDPDAANKAFIDSLYED